MTLEEVKEKVTKMLNTNPGWANIECVTLDESTSQNVPITSIAAVPNPAPSHILFG